MDQLQQSVLILSAMKNSLDPILMVFRRYINDEDVKFILHKQIILDVCSFKEEWAKLNSLSTENEDIKKTLKICSFAMKRIKFWKGLRVMRNTMIAHGFRDESNKLPTNLTTRFFEADVPSAYAEVLLLGELAYTCCAVFIKRHGGFFDEEEFRYKGEMKTKGIETPQEFDDFLARNNEFMLAIDPSLRDIFIANRGLVTSTSLDTKNAFPMKF